MTAPCAPCRKSDMIYGQWSRIVFTSWGQSHGAFSPKGHGARPPESISRLPLCISGDGVLWCGSSVQDYILQCVWNRCGADFEYARSRKPNVVERQLYTQPVAGETPARTHKAPSIVALRAIPRAFMGRAEENNAVSASVDCLYIDTPEVLDSAWPSMSSETGKPKVIGLYPPQVSGDLIRKSMAQDSSVSDGDHWRACRSH